MAWEGAVKRGDLRRPSICLPALRGPSQAQCPLEVGQGRLGPLEKRQQRLSSRGHHSGAGQQATGGWTRVTISQPSGLSEPSSDPSLGCFLDYSHSYCSTNPA